MWTITLAEKKKPSLNKPVLLAGLPGIGNVGKVTVDFLIEEVKAKKLYDFFSHTLPNSVFVNEKNVVELPKIEIYFKKTPGKKSDLLFLAGDVQPIDEASCYEFCNVVLDILAEYGGSDVITLGGIGLQQVPKNPKAYITGTSEKIVKQYKKGVKVQPSLYGVVGPIVGVSGVLLGLAGKRNNMNGISFLAETFGHPMYLGLRSAKELAGILKKVLGIKININRMEKEIAELEKEAQEKTKQLTKGSKKGNKSTALKKLRDHFGGETSYIG